MKVCELETPITVIMDCIGKTKKMNPIINSLSSGDYGITSIKSHFKKTVFPPHHPHFIIFIIISPEKTKSNL